MDRPFRISASSYSNTAPLIWPFLYGSQRGSVEVILDNAPARSAELLSQDRVDAALVPVIAYESIDGAKLIGDACVGAKEKVRSVILVTDGRDLDEVRSVSLDVSSRTSVILTKLIFKEFLEHEPQWRGAEPNIKAMLAASDSALIIGDPALAISAGAVDLEPNDESMPMPRIYDLAELWRNYTGLGFVFAMWMTRQSSCEIGFAAARDEGLRNIDAIAANYSTSTGLSPEQMSEYLTQNISYAVDDSMRQGMEQFFVLAAKHRLITQVRRFEFI